ncbi:DUF2538 family protein [Paenibacillus peoriae]|uniref:DUF2538 family protein n=1 Tax=Paenibacillus TaxID=44249 RepID=UPI00026C687A|nr:MULTISPECIES: DUF2538 family protein [Paenibacillus]MEC0182318.1 DUF2538 family protein [Paenibacillus peoriae]
MDMKDQMKTEKEQSGQPTQRGMTLGNVWFSSKEHGENFIQLIERFNAYKNPEYAAACYVVSHPEIYYRVNWSESDGPIGWYWGEWIGEDDNDENGYHSESKIVGQLSSSYRGLIQAAVELYTGTQHYFDLMSWLGNAGDEVYKLFIQSLEIRRDRFTIEIM